MILLVNLSAAAVAAAIAAAAASCPRRLAAVL